MEIRLATEGEREAVKWLWGLCFDREEPFFTWYFSECFRAENTLVCSDGGRLLGSLQMNPYQLFLRGQEVPAAYIVGVDTLPEARRQGVARALLKAAIAESRRRSRPVGILQPFRTSFYRPEGWEVCYTALRYRMPLVNLGEISDTSRGWRRLVDPSQSGGLDRVYRSFVRDRHAYVVRSEGNWRDLLTDHLGDGGQIGLLETDGQPEGYVLYRIENSSLEVRELAVCHPAGRRAAFGFLFTQRDQAETLEWQAPANDLSHLYIPDDARQVALTPYMMARLFDVQAALERLVPPDGVGGKLAIRVDDPIAAWNDATFTVEVGHGRPTCRREGTAEDVRCSVGALTQLYFGAVSAIELWRLGHLSLCGSGDGATLALLSGLFPKTDNYINELF